MKSLMKQLCEGHDLHHTEAADIDKSNGIDSDQTLREHHISMMSPSMQTNFVHSKTIDPRNSQLTNAFTICKTKPRPFAAELHSENLISQRLSKKRVPLAPISDIHTHTHALHKHVLPVQYFRKRSRASMHPRCVKMLGLP